MRGGRRCRASAYRFPVASPAAAHAQVIGDPRARPAGNALITPVIAQQLDDLAATTMLGIA